MKVAIIGAGLSGLYCALELEKYGIYPDIFEKNSFIAEPFSHIIAMLNITHRPIRDFQNYLKKNMDIEIKPINVINSLAHNGPNLSTTIKGDFGYFYKLGRDDNSLKNQLFSMLKNPKVYFNELVDYEKLKKEYDYVVVATGNKKAVEEIGVWQEWIKTYVKGAIVLGDFDPTQLIMWINKDYSKNGYAYLTPFNSKKASLVLITTDVNENEIDNYWQLFWYTENFKYTIVEEFKLPHKSGYVYPHRYENLIFIGNSGGGVEPFLGFGHLNSATMGFSAARTIIKGYDFENQIKKIMDRNLNMRHIRKSFEKQTNSNYDNIIAGLRLPGVESMIYNTNINVVKGLGFYLDHFVNDRKKP